MHLGPFRQAIKNDKEYRELYQAYRERQRASRQSNTNWPPARDSQAGYPEWVSGQQTLQALLARLSSQSVVDIDEELLDTAMVERRQQIAMDKVDGKYNRKKRIPAPARTSATC